jgi:hypothetical protein
MIDKRKKKGGNMRIRPRQGREKRGLHKTKRKMMNN